MIWLAGILLLIASIAGARLSVAVRAETTSALWLYLASAASCTAWIGFARSNVRLSLAALAFDFIAAAAYLLVIVAHGGKLSGVNAAGIAVALIGMAMMGVGAAP